MTQNEIRTNLDMDTTDPFDLDAVDLTALARLDFATIRVHDLADWLASNGAAQLSPIERIELAERLITRRRFLIGAGALGLGVITGCGADEEATAPTAATERTRTVEHVAGITEVPVSPQRIVVLDPHILLDCVMALGFEPVGIGSRPGSVDLAPWLEGEVPQNAEGVWTGDFLPNIEKIATLEPDLVIGWDWQEESYAEVSEVAPTVLVPDGGSFKTYLEKVGEVTGAEEQAEEMLVRYEEQVESVRAKVAGTKVSVVRPQDEALVLYGPSSDPGSVLTDLGVEVQPVPGGAEDFVGDASAIGKASLEYIPEISGEHIFIISYDIEEGTTPAELLQGPLWQTLEAVQAGRVHPVQGLAWTNHGPLGALQMIDEVEQAIVGANTD